jgi:hypothetical protein
MVSVISDVDLKLMNHGPGGGTFVDAQNHFYQWDPQQNKYVQFEPTLQNKFAVSHVRVFEFTTPGRVVVKQHGVHHPLPVQPGDVLIIWSNGDHKIVPPPNQKWLVNHSQVLIK